MQSVPGSKRWSHSSNIPSQFAQLRCIHESKSLSLDKDLELIRSHPHRSHGFHALESKGSPYPGFPLLSGQNLSLLSQSPQLLGLGVHFFTLFGWLAIPLTHPG